MRARPKFSEQPTQTPEVSVIRAERAHPEDVRQGEIGDSKGTRVGLGVLAGAAIMLSAFGLVIFFQIMQNSG